MYITTYKDNGGTVEWWNNCNNLFYHNETLQICTYLGTWIMVEDLNGGKIVTICSNIMKCCRYIYISRYGDNGGTVEWWKN